MRAYKRCATRCAARGIQVINPYTKNEMTTRNKPISTPQNTTPAGAQALLGMAFIQTAAELVVNTPVTFTWVDADTFTLTYTGEHPQQTARLIEIINEEGRVFAEGLYNPELDATCIVVTIKQE